MVDIDTTFKTLVALASAYVFGFLRETPDVQAAVRKMFSEGEIWLDRAGQVTDPLLPLRLAEHDTENYVGVVAHRRKESESPFGFTSWWLTLDHRAFEIQRELKRRGATIIPPSPVMSADFLTNYLAFGPVREKVSRAIDASLPVSLDPALVDYLTPELVQVANEVRAKATGLPEHVIRRKVRDALDAAKRRVGDITTRGLGVPIEEADAP